MPNHYENPIFDDKTISDVLREIHDNTTSKHNQINTFISKLVTLIKTTEDAVIVSPLIRDFLDVAVKNDAHLVHLAQVVQRLESISARPGNDKEPAMLLTEEEKSQLMSAVAQDLMEVKQSETEINAAITKLSAEV